MRDLCLGTNTATGQPLYIPKDARVRHSYILGRTGAGKSSLMTEMILQDIRGGYGVVLIDAKDLARTVWESLPRDFVEEVPEGYESRALFFSLENPIPYNPFIQSLDEPERLENELITLIDQITVQYSYTQPMTARMREVFGIALKQTLKERSGPNFSHLCSYLIDHPALIRNRMGYIPEKEFQTSLLGIKDRLKLFMRDRRLRRVLCNPHQLDFDQVLDEGLILIISLFGPEQYVVQFLGSLFLQGLQNAIRRRYEEDRKEIAIYVDEFQDYIVSHYAVQNFQKFYSQGRGFKVSMNIAHQDAGPIKTELLTTIQENVAASISFSTGPDGGQRMSRMLGSKYKPDDIQFQKFYEGIARIDNDISHFKTYTPLAKKRNFERTKYAKPDPPDPFDLSPRYPDIDNGKMEVHEPEPTYKDISFERIRANRRSGGGDNKQPPPSSSKKKRPRKGV